MKVRHEGHDSLHFVEQFSWNYDSPCCNRLLLAVRSSIRVGNVGGGEGGRGA